MDRFLLELNPETKNRLDRLRTYPEESSDQLLNRLMDSYEDGARLTREEVERIRDFLRELKEGRFTTPGQAVEEGQEKPPVSAGDLQAIQDMERIFSGTAEKVPDSGPTSSDSGDLHEIDPYDKKGRSRTPHLDSL